MTNINDTFQLCPLLKMAVVVTLGIIVGDELQECVPSAIWLLACMFMIACAIVLRRFRRVKSLVFLLSVFFAGCLMISYTEKADISIPEEDTPYEAVLLSEPVQRGKVVQADMLVVSLYDVVKVRASILRDTVNCRYKKLHAGDGILAYSHFDVLRKGHGALRNDAVPLNKRSSAGFDYRRWLEVHGYVAQTFIYHSDWVKYRVSLGRLSFVDKARLKSMKVRAKLLESYKKNGLVGQEQAVVAAMTLGDKSLIDNRMKDKYSISGASHLLALSGLHLTIVYMVLSLCFGWFRRNWLSQAVILVAIWIYVFLVGMPPSVVRAALMVTVYSVVMLSGRDRLSLNALGLAALIMLVINPLNVYDVGFQLSFMAVLSILVISPVLSSLLPYYLMAKRGLLGWLCSMVTVSLAAQIGTAPLVAYYFGRLSVLSFLVNIVAIPCAIFILYGTLAFFAMSWMPAAQAVIMKVVGWVTHLLNGCVSLVASLPFASVEGVSLSVPQVVLLYVIIVSAVTALSFYTRKQVDYVL